MTKAPTYTGEPLTVEQALGKLITENPATGSSLSAIVKPNPAAGRIWDQFTSAGATRKC